MKKIQSSLPFYFVLIFLMVFSSCATHHQVTRPPQQNKYLAKKVDRPNTNTPKRRTSSRTKHLTANKLSKNVKTIPVVKPTINYTDETPEGLIASSEEAVYLNPVKKIDKVSRDNVRINESTPEVELMDKKEQRQFKREFRKDLKESIRAAQNEAAQPPAKPARGFAIAGFVTGLVSLLILPGLFGILAVIFSGIALARLKKDPTQTGRGMAIAGLILGVVGIVWWILVLSGVISGIIVL